MTNRILSTEKKRNRGHLISDTGNVPQLADTLYRRAGGFVEKVCPDTINSDTKLSGVELSNSY